MKYIRAEKKGEDVAPQWRDPTLWVVREENVAALVGAAAFAIAAVPASVPALAEAAAAGCQTRNVSIGWAMPYHIPQWVGGDRDFHGNGPGIEVRASLVVGSVEGSGGHQGTLSVKIFMDARETKADWTQATGEAVKEIYRAPAGWFVTRPLPLVDRDTKWFHDTDWGQDDLSPGRSDSFVAEYHINGDRQGDEAGTWTRVWVETKPMNLRLSTCLNG